MLEVLVKNKGPAYEHTVEGHNINLIRQFLGDSHAVPFIHQAEVFKEIDNDQEVFLVAGTAAGKTLAVSIPLFNKLKTKDIRKIVYIYPTIALMEDQAKVMCELLRILKLENEVGILKGGMSRAELTENLIKRVILTTPDEIFWFFQKNVKYSSLLIYGLCQADEYVLDEAHLFNGLSLQNLKHLFNRIRFLRETYIKTDSFRLHILTATPSEGIEKMNNGNKIVGKSKCGDVQIRFDLLGKDYKKKKENFAEEVNKAISKSVQKILIICNSAAFAHRLFLENAFENKKKKDILHSQLLNSKEKEDYSCIKDETLIDYDNYTVDKIFESISFILINSKSQLVRKINKIFEEESGKVSDRSITFRLESDPNTKPWAAFLDFKKLNTIDDCKRAIEKKFDSVLSNLEFELYQCISDFPQDENNIKRLLKELNLNNGIIKYIAKKYKIIKSLDLHYRPSYYSFNSEKTPCIRIWSDSEYPVILYSGSMNKELREGLIDIYDRLEKAILISTSAVEVGVDFSADYLITEQTNGSSLLQRFGRIGRQSISNKSIAIIYITDGDCYSEIRDRLGGRDKLTREEFSEIIGQVLPQKKYIMSSDLIDATHYIINEQMGIIGKSFNECLFTDRKDIIQLVDQIKSAKIELSCGLRGTMPSVALKDKGVSKEPFYIFRLVDNNEIYSPGTPFELARIDYPFNSLIFRKNAFEIFVDYKRTIHNAKAIVYRSSGGDINIASYPDFKNKVLIPHIKLKPNKSTLPDEIWTLCDVTREVILLFGDVYLSRFNESLGESAIKDIYGTHIVIPNQFVLLLVGSNILDKLRKHKSEALEEIYYDVDWNGNSHHENVLVLLDKVQGACFSIFKEWTDHAN